MRVRAVLDFIFRAIFGSKTGWAGIAALLVKILAQVLSIWQTVDFLPSHIEPLLEFLNSLWGTLVLIGLGFFLMGKAVYDRWPEVQESEPREPAKASTKVHPDSENRQPKTGNKQPRKWLRAKPSRERTRKQQMSVDLNLRESNNRVAVKVLLTESEKEGRELCENDPSLEEAQQWVTYTYNLMDAALIGAARHFLNDEGLQLPNENLSDSQRWLQQRIRRLVEIRAKVDSYTVQYEFNPRDWMND